MNEKFLTEKIKFYTEIVKVLWAVIIVLTGGLSTIFINMDNPQKIILFVFGLCLECIFIILLIEANKEVNCMINKLEEK